MLDELMTAGAIVIILLLDFMIKEKKGIIAGFYTLFTLALLGFVAYYKRDGILFLGAYVYDGLSWFSKIIILAGAFLTGLLSINTIKINKKYIGAYYAILLSSVLGMMVLVSSKELITMYVGLETTTISLYALTAIYKKDDFSLEAGIKYLVLGVISSAVLLYGISLVYASTGSTSLERIMSFTGTNGSNALFITGVIMMLLGMGFKLSMVPMHVWTPDVYQGAPTPITAFISVASKAAGFIFALRVLSYTFVKFSFIWVPIVSILASLTMTIGNLVAIHQKNVKRLLAYSTISQAGYILVGFVGASVEGMSSVLFYLVAYTVTNMAAFAVIIGLSNITSSDELDDYSGLAQREPLLALTFLLALLSLAGIPPLAGFVGKFYLFYAAMQKGYLWLVIAGALNSTISLYYYLLVLKHMYIFDRTKEYPKIKLTFGVRVALLLTIAAILLIGIFPFYFVDKTIEISQRLFM